MKSTPGMLALRVIFAMLLRPRSDAAGRSSKPRKNRPRRMVAVANCNTEVSPRSAQRYMQIARSQSRLGTNATRVAHFSLREAVASVAKKQGRIARLPAPVVDSVLTGEPDVEKLLVEFRRAENLHKLRESQRRQREIEAQAQPANPIYGPFLPPVSFEDSLSENEKNFIATVSGAIRG